MPQTYTDVQLTKSQGWVDVTTVFTDPTAIDPAAADTGYQVLGGVVEFHQSAAAPADSNDHSWQYIQGQAFPALAGQSVFMRSVSPSASVCASSA